MTSLETEYSFTAAIRSKGEQGNAWKLEFDWKLPGSKFPFVLYGRDWEDIEGWDVGDRPEVVIERGNLKEGKDGRYSTDYFYDLVSIDTPSNAERPTPQRDSSSIPHPSGKGIQEQPPAPSLDPIQERIERGMAFNAAYTLLAQRPLQESLVDEDFIADLRRLRDVILREVVQVPVAPMHYCYDHEATRIQNPKSNNWAHQLPDKTWCVEAQDAATPAAGPGAEAETGDLP